MTVNCDDGRRGIPGGRFDRRAVIGPQRFRCQHIRSMKTSSGIATTIRIASIRNTRHPRAISASTVISLAQAISAASGSSTLELELGDRADPHCLVGPGNRSWRSQGRRRRPAGVALTATAAATRWKPAARGYGSNSARLSTTVIGRLHSRQ